MHYVKIIIYLSSAINVVDAVQSEGNLNQIGTLRRKMTMIGSAHVGTCRACCDVDVTGQVEFLVNFRSSSYTSIYEVMRFCTFGSAYTLV